MLWSPLAARLSGDTLRAVSSSHEDPRGAGSTRQRLDDEDAERLSSRRIDDYYDRYSWLAYAVTGVMLAGLVLSVIMQWWYVTGALAINISLDLILRTRARRRRHGMG